MRKTWRAAPIAAGWRVGDPPAWLQIVIVEAMARTLATTWRGGGFTDTSRLGRRCPRGRHDRGGRRSYDRLWTGHRRCGGGGLGGRYSRSGRPGGARGGGGRPRGGRRSRGRPGRTRGTSCPGDTTDRRRNTGRRLPRHRRTRGSCRRRRRRGQPSKLLVGCVNGCLELGDGFLVSGDLPGGLLPGPGVERCRGRLRGADGPRQGQPCHADRGDSHHRRRNRILPSALRGASWSSVSHCSPRPRHRAAGVSWWSSPPRCSGVSA